MMNTKTNEDEDLKWFDALNGRTTANTTELTEAEREGMMLREALLSEQQEIESPDENNRQAEYEKLLFRLKREGILEKKSSNPTKDAATPTWLSRISFPQSIAAAIALAIIIPVTYQVINETNSTDSPVTTPIAQTPQVFENPAPKALISELSVIFAADPEKTVELITQKLQQLNIESTAYMLNEMWHIEASTASATNSSDLIKLAQENGFIISDSGKINIRIEAQ
ncbi:hypothetical protein MNBD_GAMMA16-190 [hydrothermal vent metagenome]|uniref:Uncharacterized protein n=1 Tax=hydrothermal vent metagenome TaxID=652676 RepID=A0A3B0YWP2_9ZZZZ